MTVYALLFLYFAAGAAFEQSNQRARGGRPSGASVLLRFGGLLIALVVGLRYQVGADWFTYLQIFHLTSFADFSTALGNGDPGYQALTYLPDDILAKVDRASMAVSLETRVPFLDHRVAELAARIPLSLKVRGSKGKHIVRQLLYGLIPPAMVERPKAGFAIPIGEWIKGPLRPWAEDLLSRESLQCNGLLDPGIVRRRWADHLSGRRDSTPALWAILMLQSWLREQQSATARAA